MSDVNVYGDAHRTPRNDGAWQRDYLDGKIEEMLDIGGGYSVNLVDFFGEGIEPYRGCRQDMEFATDYDNGYSLRFLEMLAPAIQRAISRGMDLPLVYIYRAVPDHVQGEDNVIHDGDWVTLSPAYARMHGNGRYTDGYHVLSMRVPVNHVYWDGQHLCEFGYDSRQFEWNNTKAVLKSVDEVICDAELRVNGVSPNALGKDFEIKNMICGQGEDFIL